MLTRLRVGNKLKGNERVKNTALEEILIAKDLRKITWGTEVPIPFLIFL